MSFVERIFTGVTKAIGRALTPPGTGGKEAAEVQAKTATMKQDLVPPQAPGAPKSPPQFMPGSAPGLAQRARQTATTMLGAAAASGQQAKKSLLGQ